MTTNPRTRRRGLKVGLSVFGVLLLLLAALAYVAFRPGAIVAFVQERALPKVSERLGRQVTVGKIDARILPSPRAVITDLQVAGGPGEPAFVKSPEAEVTVELWPLLRSFGKQIEISGFHLRQPELVLLRRADGTFSHEEIQERLAQTSAQPASGPSRETELEIAELSIEDGKVRLIDRTRGAQDEGVALEQLDVSASDLAFGEPASFDVAAAFASKTQNLKGKIDLAKLPDGYDEARPETWPVVTAALSLKDASLARLEGFLPARLAELTTGGRIDLSIAVSTKDQRYHVKGDGALRALRLRGQPADGSLSFRTAVNLAQPTAGRIHVDELVLTGPGIDLGGTAWVQLTPSRGEFALKGNLLDLDTLLAALPADEEKAEAAAPKPLPKQVRDKLAATRFEGTLALKTVRKGKLEATDLQARGALKDGVFALERGQAKIYGGLVKLDGTKVDLTKPEPAWRLSAALSEVDVGQAILTFRQDQPLQGKASGLLTLTGEGADWESIRKNVTGQGSFAFEDGKLTRTDIGAKIAAPLAQALSKIGQAKAGAVTEQTLEGGMTLRKLSASFTVKNGSLHLSRPLTFDSPDGTASLSGRIGLDHTVDLDGQFSVKPALIARVASKGWTPSAPISVPLGIEGPLTDLTVQPPSSEQLAKALLNPAAAPPVVKEKVDAMQEDVKRQARKALEGIFKR